MIEYRIYIMKNPSLSTVFAMTLTLCIANLVYWCWCLLLSILYNTFHFSILPIVTNKRSNLCSIFKKILFDAVITSIDDTSPMFVTICDNWVNWESIYVYIYIGVFCLLIEILFTIVYSLTYANFFCKFLIVSLSFIPFHFIPFFPSAPFDHCLRCAYLSFCGLSYIYTIW